LSKDLAEDLIVPVMLGAAEKDSGVHRLLKALRHDVPGPEVAAQRLGINGDAAAIIFKTSNQQHAGQLSFARRLGGKVADGATLNGQRISGIQKPKGHAGDKIPAANPGEIAAFGRLEHAKTGDVLTASGKVPEGYKWPDPMRPLFSLAIDVENRND